ncbi:MAG: helix-turn-helix transcriptional regulator [Bacteroidetes bacterium]|nr:helix-turn-helix transcriptional regulator [Bacteroidota bacterium]
MFTASSILIVAQGDIDSNGNFKVSFPTDSAEKLYRLHFIKNGDPVSTLIIGSKDANHLFFIASDRDQLIYQNNVSVNIIRQSDIVGNKATDELNALLSVVHSDSLPRDSIKNKLIDIARTSSSELVGLLSIYNEFGLNHEQRKTLRDIVKRFNPDNPYAGRIFEDYNQPPNGWFLWAAIIFALIIALIAARRIFKKKRLSKIQQSLSQREIKIARLILEGKSNKEIAMDLNIGLSTVKTHVNNIYSKLKINSRRDLQKFKDILVESSA